MQPQPAASACSGCCSGTRVHRGSLWLPRAYVGCCMPSSHSLRDGCRCRLLRLRPSSAAALGIRGGAKDAHDHGAALLQACLQQRHVRAHRVDGPAWMVHPGPLSRPVRQPGPEIVLLRQSRAFRHIAGSGACSGGKGTRPLRMRQRMSGDDAMAGQPCVRRQHRVIGALRLRREGTHCAASPGNSG